MKKKIIIGIVLFILLIGTAYAIDFELSGQDVLGFAITYKQEGGEAASKNLFLKVLSQDKTGAQAVEAIGYIQNPQGAVIGLAKNYLSEECGELVENCGEYLQYVSAFQNPTGFIQQKINQEAQQKSPEFAQAYQYFGMLQQLGAKPAR